MPLPLIYSKRKLVPSHLWEIPCHHATMPPLTFHLFKLSYVLSGWPLRKPHFSIEATARSPCTLGNAQVTMRNLIPPPKRQQETRDMLKNIMTRYLVTFAWSFVYMGMDMDGEKQARNGHEHGMSKMQPCMATHGHAKVASDGFNG